MIVISFPLILSECPLTRKQCAHPYSHGKECVVWKNEKSCETMVGNHELKPFSMFSLDAGNVFLTPWWLDEYSHHYRVDVPRSQHVIHSYSCSPQSFLYSLPINLNISRGRVINGLQMWPNCWYHLMAWEYLYRGQDQSQRPSTLQSKQVDRCVNDGSKLLDPD